MKKFTLIELLVVVAIIGILASILMPSLSKAREKARIALCTNNIKNLTTFMHLFATDYDDKTTMQHGTHEPRNNAYFYKDNTYWHNFGVMYNVGLFPDTPELLQCPSNDGYGTTSLPRAATDYGVRPEKWHKDQPSSLESNSDLTPIAPYANLAVVSESVYFKRYDKFNSTFHKTGNVTGYGDGSVRFINDRNGSKFLNTLNVNRSSSYHSSPGQMDSSYPAGTGVWYILDQSR